MQNHNFNHSKRSARQTNWHELTTRIPAYHWLKPHAGPRVSVSAEGRSECSKRLSAVHPSAGCHWAASKQAPEENNQWPVTHRLGKSGKIKMVWDWFFWDYVMLVIVGHLIIPTPTPTWSEVIGYHLLFGVDEPTVFFTGHVAPLLSNGLNASILPRGESAKTMHSLSCSTAEQKYITIVTNYISICIMYNIIPAVPHKAVAEISKIGNL